MIVCLLISIFDLVESSICLSCGMSASVVPINTFDETVCLAAIHFATEIADRIYTRDISNTPYLMTGDEWEDTDTGRWFLGPSLYSGPYSNVFEFRKDKEVNAVKYMVACPQQSMRTKKTIVERTERTTLINADNYFVSFKKDSGETARFMQDPLIREYVFGTIAAELVPRVLFVSGPTKWVDFLESNRFRNINLFNLDSQISRNLERCGASTRFLVMEKASVSLGQYFFYRPADTSVQTVLQVVVQIGMQAILLLRKLHAIGIVHNDIHEGNLAIDGENERKILLLDLGNSVFICSPENLRMTLSNMRINHLSPWQLGDEPVGFRDDMYRVFEMVVKLMNPARFGTLIQEHVQSRSALFEFKSRIDYFDKTTEFDVFQGGEIDDRVRTLLSNCLKYIRQIPEPGSIVDYDYLLHSL